MSAREQNERKFPNWEELPEGGRRYWLGIPGRHGWRARYVKEKYPVDRGHQKVEGET